MSSNPYEMMGQLPGRVAYARRYQVFHRVLGKVVEFRVLPKSATPDHRAAYYRELEELLALDHPCFPPVLERGTVRKRQAYVIPFREHPSIPERIAAHTFFPAQAYAAVSSLAGGLAAQHDQGMLAGPIEPSQVSWDDRAASAYYLQRRHRSPKFLTSGEHVFPADILAFEAGTPAADVFHWGFFAYFLLSRGKYPYETPEALRPLSTWGGEVPHYLSVAVEAALSWDPTNRPVDGAALQKVLLVGGVGGFAAVPAPTSKAAPTVDQSASQAFLAFMADIDELHLSLGPKGGEASPRALAPQPSPRTGGAAPTAAPSGEDPAAPAGAEADAPAARPGDEADDPDLSMATYQSGSGLAAIVLPEEAAPPEEEDADDPDVTGEFAGALRGLETNVDMAALQRLPAPPPAASRLAPVGVAALCLGVGLGWAGRGWLAPPTTALVVTSTPAPKGPRLPRPRARPRETSDGAAIIALPPSRATPYREDDQVMRLLRLDAVPADRVKKTWKTIRSLMLQGRLPPVLSDTKRLVAMRRAIEADRTQGPKVLQGYLTDMRTVLGPAKAASP